MMWSIKIQIYYIGIKFSVKSRMKIQVQAKLSDVIFLFKKTSYISCKGWGGAQNLQGIYISLETFKRENNIIITVHLNYIRKQLPT